MCGKRPGETFHHHLPLCQPCKRKLDRDIQRYGGVIVQGLDALRLADSPQSISDISLKVIESASHLVPYEDQRIKTTDPEPTVIIHRVRVGEYADLFPRLASGTNDDAE